MNYSTSRRSPLVLLFACLCLLLPSPIVRAGALPTQAVIRILALGGSPTPAAVDKADNRVFALDSVHDRVFVLDSRNGKLLATFSLPGAGDLNAAAYDPRTHHLLIAAIAYCRPVPGLPESVAHVYTIDARNLASIRSVEISHRPAGSFGNAPNDIVIDRRIGLAYVVRYDGAVITLNTATGRVSRYSWSHVFANREAVDPFTDRLFVINGGADLRGADTSVTMLNANTGKQLTRVSARPPPPRSLNPVSPLGESASLIGLDSQQSLLFVAGVNWGANEDAVVKLSAQTGRVVSYATLRVAGPGLVDPLLGRMYLTISSPSLGLSEELTTLSETDLHVLHHVLVGTDVGAIGLDIHAHRIFTVDGFNGRVQVFDSWSGSLIRTVRLARPVNEAGGGPYPVSALVSGPTHRAFIGEGNGKIAVLNSALQPAKGPE